MPFCPQRTLPHVKAPIKAANLLVRHGIRYKDIKAVCGEELPEEVEECVETELRYKGYIEKQQRQVEKFASLEKKRLPENLNYKEIKGIRLEAAAKLAAVRPETLGQAMRISGVSPADISVLAVYLSSRNG